MANPVRVYVAFDDDPLTVSPTWTRIDTWPGLRVQEIAVDRGRGNEFEKTGTGTAVVRGADVAGVLDPTNSGSPFTGNINPNKQAMIELRDPVAGTFHTIFRGFIDDWGFAIDVGTHKQQIKWELQLVDGFAFLANYQLQPGSDGDALPNYIQAGNVWYAATLGPDGVKDRLLAILNDAGWPADLIDAFSGNVTLAEKTYGAGTSALAALGEAVDGEYPGLANHFISNDGIYTFRGRQPRFRPDVAEYAINERNVGDPSVDPTCTPIAGLSFNRGTATIYNRILATPDGILPTDVAGQLVSDSASVSAYGPRSLTFENLLTLEGLATSNTALEETKTFGTNYKANYKDPRDRVSRLTFRSKLPAQANAAALWAMICRAEISDLLNLKTSHVGGGGFDEAFFVEGLHYQIRPGNSDVADVSLDCDVSSAGHYAVKTFDDDPDPS